MLTDIVYSDLVQWGPGSAEELAVRLREHVVLVRDALAILVTEGRVTCVVASVAKGSTPTFYAGDLTHLLTAA